MPKKCPHCARRLHLGGLLCRACRRYILRWYHLVPLALLALAAALALLDLLSNL